MNWWKIIFFVLSALIAIGGLHLTKPERSGLAKILIFLIVIATIIGIILEIKDIQEHKLEQTKAEKAYAKIDEQHSVSMEKDKRIEELEKKQEKLKEDLEDVDSKTEALKILPKVTIESAIFKNLGIEGLDYKFSIALKYIIESEIPARAYNVKHVDCIIYDGLNKAGSFKIEDSYIFKYQRGERTRTLTGGSKIQIIDPKIQLVLYVDDEIIESNTFDLIIE